MKTFSYVCPKHSDVVFYKDSEPENFTGHVKNFVKNGAATLLGGILIQGLFPVFTVGPNIGPFECKKCKKYYFKWECEKHED